MVCSFDFPKLYTYECRKVSQIDLNIKRRRANYAITFVNLLNIFFFKYINVNIKCYELLLNRVKEVRGRISLRRLDRKKKKLIVNTNAEKLQRKTLEAILHSFARRPRIYIKYQISFGVSANSKQIRILRLDPRRTRPYGDVRCHVPQQNRPRRYYCYLKGFRTLLVRP